MNQNFDFLKKELSLEIKEIAKEIANIESYTGLLTHEIKFKKLYEKFIVLKFLDKKRIYIEDLNLPTDAPIEILEKDENSINILQDENAEEEVIYELKEEDEYDETINNIKESKEFERDIEVPSSNEQILARANPIKLDLNDKIAFRAMLFNGDSDAMDLVLKTLNRIKDLPSSLLYLDELRNEMEWGSNQDEFINRLKELIYKRFNQ